jgi:hypothetical protein
VYELSSSSFGSACDCLDNLSLDSLLKLVRDKYILHATEDAPRIRISTSDSHKDLLDTLLAFYKGSRFQKDSFVKVSIMEERVVDVGGVRRQLYSTVFNAVSVGEFELFDGIPSRIHPTVKPSNIASGLLKIFRVIIAHSLVMGFTFLAPPAYYYMAGKEDVAASFLTHYDTSGQAHHVVVKVCLIQ